MHCSVVIFSCAETAGFRCNNNAYRHENTLFASCALQYSLYTFVVVVVVIVKCALRFMDTMFQWENMGERENKT